MIYENKYLPRLTSVSQADSTDLIMELAGLKMIRYEPYRVQDEVIRVESKTIVKHYINCSDLLQFLSSATHCNAHFLKYKLNPPITTSRMDCEYILDALARIGFLSDYSYSKLTTSIWIERNRTFSYTICELLNIGICELIGHTRDVKCNVELRSQTGIIWSDIVITSEKKVSLIHVELAAGLETDVPSHVSQLEKLKTKMIKARRRANNYMADYIVITPAVFQQLPKALQEMECIMTIESVETKARTLDF